jgi:DNA-binding response OmpR family regulator
MPTDASSSPERMRLLIVDDDAELAEFLRAGLKVHFSLIMVVGTVAQAKCLLAGPFVFDLIVGDYQLPDGTGMDLYQWMRQELKTAIPFLMISGKVDPILIDGDAGFGFLGKPFELPRLLELLHQFPAMTGSGEATSSL